MTRVVKGRRRLGISRKQGLQFSLALLQLFDPLLNLMSKLAFERDGVLKLQLFQRQPQDRRMFRLYRAAFPVSDGRGCYTQLITQLRLRELQPVAAGADFFVDHLASTSFRLYVVFESGPGISPRPF